SWFHVVCWHDSVANQIGISVNGSDPDIGGAPASGPTSFPADAFWLGQKGNNTQYWDGRIDEVGFWKRLLTSTERFNLYNLGNGFAYPFDGPVPPPLLINLVSYWKLDEASGNAIDSHGTNHLTDVNTVASAAGKIGTA